jgi:hypothetical protein
MLPPSSNQLDVLPRALVVYSHHLLGNAIKLTLVRLGVEVELSPINGHVFSQNASEYAYVFVVFSGQEDFFESQSLLAQFIPKLSSKTKLSIVVSVAQAGIHRPNQLAVSKPQAFDSSETIKAFTSLHQNVADNNIKTQLVLVRDVVDDSASDLVINPLQALLNNLDSQRITIVGAPEQEYYPLSSDQAAEVLVRELFVLRNKQHILGVRGRQAMALISLAYEIKQVLVQRGITTTQMVSLFPEHRFVSFDESFDYTTPTKTCNLNDCLDKVVVQPTPLSQEQVPHIKELPIPTQSTTHLPPVVIPAPQPVFLSKNKPHKNVVANPKKITTTKLKTPAIKTNPLPKKHIKKSRVVKGLSAFLLLCATLALILAPFLSYAVSSKNIMVASPETNPDSRAVVNLMRAQEQITGYLSFVSRLTPHRIDAKLFALNERFKQSTNALLVQTHLEQLTTHLSDLVAKHLNLRDGDVYQGAAELAQLAQQNYQDLTTLELGSPEISGSVLSGKEPEFSLEKIKTLKATLKKMQLGLESLPYLFPPNQSTNVLVLIQNSHELRATGGFIESVGLLRFNSGKLVSSEFSSSYELDELLNGKVEPPEDLRQFLGENLWYGRDANWDPDFVNSAKNSAWFYEKQTNTSVDLVVALTIPALADLLDSMDGVELADNTLLDGSNLSSWLTQSQKKLSGEQSTQPLLQPVVELMLKKIQTPDQVDLVKASQALGASLERADMLVAGVQPKTNTSLSSLGWTGAVLSPACPTVLSQAQCVVDTLYINESNVGVNSANAQVSRTQTHTTTFQGDSIAHTHQINFVHAGQNESWPGGVYQNYMRVYLPQTAELVSVSQDGVNLSDADMVQYPAQNKNVVGFLVRIQPGAASQVVINYDEINPMTSQNALTYVFLMQKQPGIAQAPLSVVLDYPAGYSLKRVSHPYALSDNHLMVNDTLAKHFFLAVELNP